MALGVNVQMAYVTVLVRVKAKIVCQPGDSAHTYPSNLQCFPWKSRDGSIKDRRSEQVS